VRGGHAVLLLGLMLWAEPAAALKLKVHALTVAIHPQVNPSLTQNEIEQILQLASGLLHASRCGAGFSLKSLTSFTSAPAVINDAADLEAVHSVPADVKVVQEVNFCIRGAENGLIGCSWRPNDRPRTMIVTTRVHGFGLDRILWAHEFGHVAGLAHRSDDRRALMTPCGLDAFNLRINRDECRHFVAGPAQHFPPGLGPACPGIASRHRIN